MGIRPLILELPINITVCVNCHTARCGGSFGPAFDTRRFEFRNIPRLRSVVGLEGKVTNYIVEGSEKMNFIVYGKLHFLAFQ